MMRTLSTIMRPFVSLVLTIALIVSPVVSASAACGAATSAPVMISAKTSPCDMPCKGCPSDAKKSNCKGECVCVKSMSVYSPASAILIGVTASPAPYSHSVLTTIAAPPDPPPPRTTLSNEHF